MNKQLQNVESEIDYPISKEKIENCYKSNGETYPLCKGKYGDDKCNYCNLYENMTEPYDDI